jgi:hypothetical protein
MFSKSARRLRSEPGEDGGRAIPPRGRVSAGAEFKCVGEPEKDGDGVNTPENHSGTENDSGAAFLAITFSVLTTEEPLTEEFTEFAKV